MVAHRSFTDDFKRDAVKRAAEPGVNKSALAKTLEISGNILHRWIREEQAVASGTPRAPRGRPRREGTQTQQAKGSSSTVTTAQNKTQGRGTVRRSNTKMQDELNALNAERKQLKDALSAYINA